MVQMGSPPGHGNENKTGWAWIDTQPGQHLQILEAYRLADLVGNTLRLQVRLPGSSLGVQPINMPQVRCLPKPCKSSHQLMQPQALNYHRASQYTILNMHDGQLA